MTAEDNRALSDKVFEAFNTGNADLLDEVISPAYVERTPVPPGWPPGRDGLKAFIRTFRTAFPDFRYTVEDTVCEGDKIAVRASAQGTHRGEFLGIPPTGKRATWTEMHLGRIADGKFVEHWANADQLGLFQQLGVVPEPSQAAQ